MQHGKNDDIEEGNSTEPHAEQEPGPVQSYAFPLHEEPEEPEKTCAICLDEFGECLLVNAIMFHREA